MVLRNRTVEFRQARDDHARRKARFGVSIKPTLSQHLLNHPPTDDEQGLEMVALKADTPVAPPQWLIDIDTAQCGVETLKEELERLQRTYRRQSIDVFGSDESQFELRLLEASNRVSQMFRDTDMRLAKLVRPTNKPEEDTYRRNAARALSNDVSDLVKIFRQCQAQYLDRNTKPHDLLQQPEDTESLATGVPEQEMMLQPDHREVLSKINTIMQEVQMMFQQTSNLVIEQGSMLDRIDYNVGNTVERCEDANRVLHMIERDQRKGFIKRVSLFLVSLDAFLLLLIILKWAAFKKA